MRANHVQGKQPHLQKAWFLEIRPCAGEKEKSPKPTEWMEAWWMGFSFWLSIYHSWFPWEYGWIRRPCAASVNSLPELKLVLLYGMSVLFMTDAAPVSKLRWPSFNGHRTHQEPPNRKGLLPAVGLLCEPVPLETDGFFGETKFHLRFHLRFNLFSRGFCELPVNILKLIDMAWADSSLQELHEITAASVNSLPELKLVLRYGCMSVSCVMDAAPFSKKLRGPSSNGHRTHQEPPNRKGLLHAVASYVNQFHLKLVAFLEKLSSIWGSISFREDFASFQSTFSSWLTWLGLILAYKNYMKSLLLRSIPFQN